jgi:hypothetical protein
MENVTPPMGFRRIQAAALLDFDNTEPSVEFERLVADIANILGSPPAKGYEDSTLLLQPTEF